MNQAFFRKCSLLRLRRDEKGVAAVEFALILPLMITLYLGSSEVTQGVLASRKLAIVARTLADITAQQPNAISPECAASAQAGVCDATMTTVYSAAQQIMAPFSGATLKMTLASVEIKAKSVTAPLPPASKVYNNLVAVVRWAKAAPGANAGTPRDCTTLLLPVATGVAPALANLPQGLYSTGGILIADVSYTYTPTFGRGFLEWAGSSGGNSIAMKNTSYMRPRNWSGFIPYVTTNTPNCTHASGTPDPGT